MILKCNLPFAEPQCGELINNPVEIEDFEKLDLEIESTCYYDGREDYKAGKPLNKDKCRELGGIRYEAGYEWACQQNYTESSCTILMDGKESYCPSHPDIVACADFLHNATNKRTVDPSDSCGGMGDPHPNFSCPQEINPERYCLQYDNPTFCKTIGDLCDTDGFVKPEYPYCTE